MKKILTFVACAVIAVGSSASADVVDVWVSDFDGTAVGGPGSPRGGSTGAVVAAPAGFTGASGNVLEITLESATSSRWGSVEPGTGPNVERNLALPAGTQAGDTWTFTADQYTAPAGNGFDDGIDFFGGITLRWNTSPGTVPGNNADGIPTTFGGMAIGTAGTSSPISISGTVPAGATHVMPLLGVTNTDTMTAGGPSLVYGYLDNISFQVDITPIPEPTSGALMGLLGIGAIVRRRRG